MSFVLHPWQLFFLILSGFVNRQQQEIIEFQNAQIRVLMDKMGRKRILLTDDQRRVLAAKGKALGRRALMELTTIVTPDTILRWHRRLISREMGLQRAAQEGLRDDRQCPTKLSASSSAWPGRTRPGATTGSRERSPTSAYRDLRHHRREYPQGTRHRTGT